MRLRGLLLSLISLSCVSVSTTTIVSRESSLELSPRPISMVWNIYLQDLSDRWRMLYPELQTARAHEPAEKTFSSDKWEPADNFEYLNKYFDTAARMRSSANEREEGRARNDIATRGKLVPLQNIIREPTYCPEGERMDINEKCRIVIPTKLKKSWESEQTERLSHFV